MARPQLNFTKKEDVCVSVDREKLNSLREICGVKNFSGWIDEQMTHAIDEETAFFVCGNAECPLPIKIEAPYWRKLKWVCPKCGQAGRENKKLVEK